MRWLWLTPVKSVGRKKKPLVGEDAVGLEDLGPLVDAPVCTSSCTFASWPAELMAPTSVFLSSGSPTRRVEEACLELVKQRVVNALLHEEPRAGAAHLALVEVDAVDDPLNRLVERRVVEDDVGGLAAELEGQLLVGAGHGARDHLAHRGRAPVKATLLTSGCETSSIPISPGPGDDVHDTRRQLGLAHHVREQVGGERRGGGWLEDHRVAGGEGGGQSSRPASASGSSKG